MHPQNVSNKPTANIDDWSYIGGDRLLGTISNHYRQSDFQTNLQMTSRIIRIDEKEGFAETENTFFILGKRME
jgi:hypothetical protein